MKRYKLLEGTHYEQNPNFDIHAEGANPHAPERFVRYERGAVVESDRPLNEIYVNKFEVVHEDQQQPVSQQRRQEVDQMVADGFWPEQDRSLWEQMPQQQYDRLKEHFTRTEAPSKVFGQKAPDGPLGPQKQEEKPPEPAPGSQEPKPPEPTPGSQEKSLLGDDVTDKFPKAKDSGLRIFSNPSGKHQVALANDPNKALNLQPLSGSKVNQFVDDFVRESK